MVTREHISNYIIELDETAKLVIYPFWQPEFSDSMSFLLITYVVSCKKELCLFMIRFAKEGLGCTIKILRNLVLKCVLKLMLCISRMHGALSAQFSINLQLIQLIFSLMGYLLNCPPC